VLVERVMPSRPRLNRNGTQDDEEGEPASAIPMLAGTAGEGSVALSGHSRHNKLVHLAGDPELVGHTVTVVVDHAGPFALRGRAVAQPTAAVPISR
jgi:hypothetical protein